MNKNRKTKNYKERNKKSHISQLTSHHSGITLVALVVTLIVLLILAGVTITSLMGDSGIITKAQEAANAMNDAIQSEQDEINALIEELNSIMSGTETGGDDTEEGLSAEDIATGVASNPEAYYGKTVSGYTCTNSSAVANWKIFYAGNDFSSDGSYHVYLIADDYIARESIPASSAGNKLNDGSSSYPKAAYFTNILNDYEGSADITNADVKKLNNDYFTQNHTSTNNNMKSVAYMLDTNAWSAYAGEDAEYAVGGPSIEMLMKSYSQAHNVDYGAQASSATGYQISTDGGTSWKNNMTTSSEYLDVDDSLYVISSNSDAYGLWVASPSADNADGVMGVYYIGSVGYANYRNSSLRFSPPSLSKF